MCHFTFTTWTHFDGGQQASVAFTQLYFEITCDLLAPFYPQVDTQWWVSGERQSNFTLLSNRVKVSWMNKKLSLFHWIKEGTATVNARSCKWLVRCGARTKLYISIADTIERNHLPHHACRAARVTAVSKQLSNAWTQRLVIRGACGRGGDGGGSGGGGLDVAVVVGKRAVVPANHVCHGKDLPLSPPPLMLAVQMYLLTRVWSQDHHGETEDIWLFERRSNLLATHSLLLFQRIKANLPFSLKASPPVTLAPLSTFHSNHQASYKQLNHD